MSYARRVVYSMLDKDISLIIPALNEADSLSVIIEKIKNIEGINEVIVVDDGSWDDTQYKKLPSHVRLIKHPYNMGNGAAIKTGIRRSLGKFLIFMDADGQHDSHDIYKLINNLETYHMVIGARSKQQHASLARRFMNGVFNCLASYVTGFPVKDLTSGFRAVRADLARDVLPLLPNGYSWPTTMTLVLLRSGMSIKYIPINVRPRKYGQSRVRPAHDAIRFFLIIMKICTIYSPFRIFLPVSLSMFVLGLLNYLYTYVTAGRFTNMSALMFSSSVIIFMLGLISEQISQISLFRHQIKPPEKQKMQDKIEDRPESDDRV